MKTRLLLCLLLGMIFPSALCAQGLGTLTGTVTDSDSSNWINATVTFTVVSPTGFPPVNIYTGAAVPNPVKLTLSSAGAFTGSNQLTRTDAMTPAGSYWTVCIQPQASVPQQCLKQPFTLTASSYNAGSWISALITAPRFSGSAIPAYGYADAEVIVPMIVGATYYNVTNTAQRLCTVVNDSGACTTWITVGNSCTTCVQKTGDTMTGTLNGPLFNGNVQVPLTGMLKGNGSTTPASVAVGSDVQATIGTPPGLVVLGDSIACGFQAYPVTNGFAYLLRALWGGPYINSCVSGDQALDTSLNTLTGLSVPNTSDYTVEIGTNDVTYYNSSANLQLVFRRIIQHLELFPAAWSLSTYAQSGTLTGTWVADNTLVYGMGETSTTNGSTVSLTVNVPKAGGTIDLGYMIYNGDAGSFTVAVDGVGQTDPISSSSTFIGYGDGSSTITTHNGASKGVVAARLTNGGSGWSAGNHTVLITVTSSTGASNPVTIDYGVSAPVSAASLPVGYAVSLNPQNNANASLVATYNTIVSNVVTNYTSDGWAINYVNTNNALNTSPSCTGGASPPFTNCYADTLHPNNTGYEVMAATYPTTRQTNVTITTASSNPNSAAAFNGYNTPMQFWSPDTFGSNNGCNVLNPTRWCPGVRWMNGSQGQIAFTTYTPGYGILNAASVDYGNNPEWSWCPVSGTSWPTPASIGQCIMTLNPSGTADWFQHDGTYETFGLHDGVVYIGYNPGAPSVVVENSAVSTYYLDWRTATSSVSYSSTTQWFRTNCWHAGGDQYGDFGWQNVSGGSGTDATQTMTLLFAGGCAGTKALDLTAAGTVKLPAVTVNGVPLSQPTANGVANLASGTVTISTAAACSPSSTCKYQVSNCGIGSSTALGIPTIGPVTAGTSFVINSESAVATLVTGDNSLVCYQITP
jgi:lysophospholipase L1-like esterase